MENSKTFSSQDNASLTSLVLEIIGHVATTNMVQNTKMKLRKKLDRQWKSAILYKGFFSSTRLVEERVAVLARTF